MTDVSGGAVGLARRMRDLLPRGRLLNEEEWSLRHRAITALLWLHAIGLPAFGMVRGYGVVHSLAEGGALIAIPAVIASIRASRTARTIAASLGLLLSSALLVHLSGGMIEAHFHFFVVVGVLTIYQDWLPFLLAIGFTVSHHLVLGIVAPFSVFSHEGAWRSPLKWALIHGLFVLASSSAYIVAWRMNERARAFAEESFKKLRSSEERFRSLVQNAMDAVTVVDAEARITYQSPSVTAVLGYPSDSMVGMDGLELVHPDDLQSARDILSNVMREAGATAVAEIRVRNSRDQYRWIDCRVTNLLEDENIRGIVTNFRDVTERKALESRLAAQALHDPLTGLANRLLLTDRVKLALERTARSGRPMALMYVDLDNFKSINDTMGHDGGDDLLRIVADALRAQLRQIDTAARLGGDEFAVLLEETDEAGTSQVAGRLLTALTQPIDLGGKEVYVNASIGIFYTDTGHETAGDVLRNADLAMYVAKARGKGTYALFEPSMYSTKLEAASLKSDIHKALDSEEFVPFYQPILDMEERRVVAFEALARWDHPVRGLIMPVEFIPLAEESGAIVGIGRRITRQACSQIQLWRSVFDTSLRLNVNVSARELQDPGLVDSIIETVRASDLPGDALVIELTENHLMRDVDSTAEKLKALRAQGIKIAIDDFGTGQSSLGLLRQLPIDVMKIDRSFVMGLDGSESDAAFVQAILNLAKSLHLETIAEGVETEDQAELLTRLCCPSAQGFLYARPLSAADAELFLAGEPSRRSLRGRTIRLAEKDEPARDVVLD